MKVTMYGASGRAGSRIMKELQNREHDVTAVVRHPEKLPPGTKHVSDDLSRADRIAEIIAGSDVVISAYMPPPDDTEELIPVTERLIQAVGKAAKPRLIVVGGAASLEVAPGVTLLDSGHLPTEWIAIAKSHAKTLDLLKKSSINWTYFSPAAFFEPGERTGKFRLGKDLLISDENGKSRISMEDYAIAMVDEIEKPAHERARFTIGY